MTLRGLPAALRDRVYACQALLGGKGSTLSPQTAGPGSQGDSATGAVFLEKFLFNESVFCTESINMFTEVKIFMRAYGEKKKKSSSIF